jgi:hypothetical protein
MRWLVALTILFAATVAAADCAVNSIVTSDGRILTCTICCHGGSCATTCSR